jgi:hypothetical protein
MKILRYTLIGIVVGIIHALLDECYYFESWYPEWLQPVVFLFWLWVLLGVAIVIQKLYPKGLFITSLLTKAVCFCLFWLISFGCVYNMIAL